MFRGVVELVETVDLIIKLKYWKRELQEKYAQHVKWTKDAVEKAEAQGRQITKDYVQYKRAVECKERIEIIDEILERLQGE